ncbi:hypothetical protein ACFQ9Z_17285 [Streptomyces sp. NPDC056580]
MLRLKVASAVSHVVIWSMRFDAKTVLLHRTAAVPSPAPHRASRCGA